MSKYLFILLFNIYFFNSNYLNAQCTACDITNPTITGQYAFPANKKVCFTQNTTFQDATFENNAKICISPNVTVTFNTNTTSSTGYFNEFDIQGTLNYTGSNPDFKSDLKIMIAPTGTLNIGSSGMTITNSETIFINNGTMNFNSTLNFASATATNYFENNGTINIIRINASKGYNTIYNKGSIYLSNTFDNNSTTLYINCGYVESFQGFNMGGARLINTGTIQVDAGNSDFSTTSRVENYGIASFLGGINGGTNSSIYNEGLVKLGSVNMNGMKLEGPTNNDKKGYFYIKEQLNPNSAKVGQNLDFVKYTSFNPDTKSSSQGSNIIFSNSPIYVDNNGNSTTASVANVTFDCQANGNCTAPLITSINMCPDTDGNFQSFCVKPGSISTNVASSNIGISTYKVNNNFPQNIPNGQLVLSSKNKGLVITRVQNSSVINLPIEGMLIYDIDANCIKLYNGSIWKCIERTCNE